MPAKLFAPLRTETDALRALKADFEKSLQPFQKLTALPAETVDRRAELLAKLLEDPTDAKALTAFRSCVASIAADKELFAAAHGRMANRREAFAVELVEHYVALGQRALELIKERLTLEGFAFRPDPGMLESPLMEVPSESAPIPNTALGMQLVDMFARIEDALAWRNSQPATLENILATIDASLI